MNISEMQILQNQIEIFQNVLIAQTELLIIVVAILMADQVYAIYKFFRKEKS